MLSDDEFRQLLDHLDRPWSGYRKIRKGVKKRLRQHMTALGCTTIQYYLQEIDHDLETRAECERRLTVTISRFFRDKYLWDQLHERILPALAKRFPQSLTAWSAGCANGEEPYTLSMVWEELASRISPLPIMKILGTDSSTSCLQRAREGLYPISSLKEVPGILKHRWFQKARSARQWRISNKLQERIFWQAHQLLDEPPQGVFHLILLRNNLLTYYQGSRMEKAFEQIMAVLADGGILILGSHEQPPAVNKRLERDSYCPWVYTTRPIINEARRHTRKDRQTERLL